jgi:hypothetical protein
LDGGVRSPLCRDLLQPCGLRSESLEHFTKCHQRAASVARKLKGDTLEELTAALDKFLSTYHAEDPKVRAAVIDYLIELAAQVTS